MFRHRWFFLTVVCAPLHIPMSWKQYLQAPSAGGAPCTSMVVSGAISPSGMRLYDVQGRRVIDRDSARGTFAPIVLSGAAGYIDITVPWDTRSCFRFRA